MDRLRERDGPFGGGGGCNLFRAWRDAPLTQTWECSQAQLAPTCEEERKSLTPNKYSGG